MHGCVEGLLAACENTTVCAHCWSDGGFRPAACWLWQAEQMRPDMLQRACCARRWCEDSSAVMRCLQVCLQVWLGQVVRAGDWGRGQALGMGSSPCAACITQQPSRDDAANRRPAWHLVRCCSIQQGCLMQVCPLSLSAAHPCVVSAEHPLTYTPTRQHLQHAWWSEATTCLSGGLPGPHAPFMLPHQTLPEFADVALALAASAVRRGVKNSG